MEITPKTLANLIKVCKKQGIRSLSLGDIKIEFEGGITNGNNKKSKSEINQKENEKGVIQNNLNIADEDLSQLMVTDPVEYERVLERVLDENNNIGQA